MKTLTTTINSNSVSIEFDHHYNNVWCIDIYVNDSFARQDLPKETKVKILQWIEAQIKSLKAQDLVLCLSVFTKDGHGEHRTKMFERLGFTYQGTSPLMYC